MSTSPPPANHTPPHRKGRTAPPPYTTNKKPHTRSYRTNPLPHLPTLVARLERKPPRLGVLEHLLPLVVGRARTQSGGGRVGRRPQHRRRRRQRGGAEAQAVLLAVHLRFSCNPTQRPTRWIVLKGDVRRCQGGGIRIPLRDDCSATEICHQHRWGWGESR